MGRDSIVAYFVVGYQHCVSRVSRKFCRLHVADLQFVEKMGWGVIPGFQCLGPSFGWFGERVVPGCSSCDVMCVVREVFCIILSSKFQVQG